MATKDEHDNEYDEYEEYDDDLEFQDGLDESGKEQSISDSSSVSDLSLAQRGDHPVVNRVLSLIQPIVDDLGLDLYDLEFGGGVLKITVDTPPGSPGGIDVDQLSRVTRLVSREMDHSDPIPGHYTLEVSSPGLERNLRTPRHFARESGKTIAVRLRHVVQGERRITGELIAAGPDTFTVRQDSGSERVIAYDDVDRARTVFVWEVQPKPGQKAGSKKKSNSTKGPGKAGAQSSSAASPADFQDQNDEQDMNEQVDRKVDNQESAES